MIKIKVSVSYIYKLSSDSLKVIWKIQSEIFETYPYFFSFCTSFKVLVISPVTFFLYCIRQSSHVTTVSCYTDRSPPERCNPGRFLKGKTPPPLRSIQDNWSIDIPFGRYMDSQPYGGEFFLSRMAFVFRRTSGSLSLAAASFVLISLPMPH